MSYEDIDRTSDRERHMKIKSGIINKEDGFIVQVLFLIFYVLERISVFYWFRKLGFKLTYKEGTCPKENFFKSYIFPEIWAVLNLLFAIVVSKLIVAVDNKYILIVLAAYAALRIFETLIYQINVLFFHRLNPVFLETPTEKAKSDCKDETKTEKNKNDVTKSSGYKIKSATRTVILLIGNMVEYVFQFAIIYVALCTIMEIPLSQDNFILSFELFMNMMDLEGIAQSRLVTVAYIETVVGMFFNILCLSRFVGLLPQVEEIGVKGEKE